MKVVETISNQRLHGLHHPSDQLGQNDALVIACAADQVARNHTLQDDIHALVMQACILRTTIYLTISGSLSVLLFMPAAH
jgi:hypothetical protein